MSRLAFESCSALFTLLIATWTVQAPELPEPEPKPVPATTEAPATPFRIFTTTLPNGTAGTDYSAVLTATDGLLPFSFSIIAGDLPAGLALSSNGIASSMITGTPLASGSWAFTVEAIDASSSTCRSTFTLDVAPRR